MLVSNKPEIMMDVVALMAQAQERRTKDVHIPSRSPGSRIADRTHHSSTRDNTQLLETNGNGATRNRWLTPKIS